MVKHPIKMTEAMTCCFFEIYFYKSLFNPDEKSKIQNNKKVTKKTTIKLLPNELFKLA